MTDRARFSLSCSAILFDLDGVLVDSATCVENTWRRWAERHQLDADHVISVAHGRRTIETVQMLAPHLGATNEAATLAASESQTTDGVFEVPGARELLESLPRHRWAIVTSGIRAVATLRIRHTGLPMPDVLVCADEIERGKPHPEGYLTAARRLGADPASCVVIEDAPAGLAAARAGGMPAIGIEGTYAGAALTQADHVVRRLSDLTIAYRADGDRIEINGIDARD
jgi:sugar-phosphatase